MLYALLSPKDYLGTTFLGRCCCSGGTLAAAPCTSCMWSTSTSTCSFFFPAPKVSRLWSAPGCRLPAAAWRRWASSAAWRCWCRTSQNYRELSHGLLQCESQKKIKKEEKKHQKKNKKELINSKTQDSLLEIKKNTVRQRPKQDPGISQDTDMGKRKIKKEKKDQDLFESS